MLQRHHIVVEEDAKIHGLLGDDVHVEDVNRRRGGSFISPHNRVSFQSTLNSQPREPVEDFGRWKPVHAGARE